MIWQPACTPQLACLHLKKSSLGTFDRFFSSIESSVAVRCRPAIFE
jgi:hypothetical protein